MAASTPKFCGQCGGALAEPRLQEAGRRRRACVQCGEVAYDNPRVLVTTIVALGNRVLLCRRAEPPAAGRWTLPGGFMESNETLEEAAARETAEETGVSVDPRQLRLYGVAAMPEISEIYVGFLIAISAEPHLAPGAECTHLGFFSEAELPWPELAYPDIGHYLRGYFKELQGENDMIHFGSLENAIAIDKSYRIAEVEESRRPRVSPGSHDTAVKP